LLRLKDFAYDRHSTNITDTPIDKKILDN